MEVRKLVITVILFVAFSIFLFWFQPTKKGKILRLCTWSDYLAEDILKDFEKETGISISVSYFSSNEELLSKIRAGAKEYDLIQPSDYMVRQMIRYQLLTPIDHRLLPNLVHLEEESKNLVFDPGLKYSVPFAYGTTGVSINTDKIKIPLEGVSWKFFFESPEIKQTSLLDDMKEVFGLFFIREFGNPNIQNITSLEKAFKELTKVKRKIMLFSSEPRPLLLKGEVLASHIFSVDGLRAERDNPKIKYFIPNEGATIWTDNFAIPKESINPGDAHLFLNFLLDPRIAARVSQQNALATPNLAAKQLLPKEVLGDPRLYPPAETRKKLFFLDSGEEFAPQLERYWTEMKSS